MGNCAGCGGVKLRTAGPGVPKQSLDPSLTLPLSDKLEEEDELKLGDGNIPPGSPTRRDKDKHVQLSVLEFGGIPKSNFYSNSFFCEVWYDNGKTKFLSIVSPTETIDNDGGISFKEDVMVNIPKGVDSSDSTADPPMVRIEIFSSFFETAMTLGFSKSVGKASFPVSELEEKNEWKLYIFDDIKNLVYDRDNRTTPCYVRVSIPRGRPEEAVEDRKKTDKRCVMITRGTRGDVQPFIALARGLAEKRNWDITIVTELGFRELVLKNSKVSSGAIHFRPSGGDTESRIDRRLLKWFMRQNSPAFQMLMLARAEREFFESEPAFSYFSLIEKGLPDLLIFGFNTAAIAMILHERYHIPITGFILQPTIIPSKQYPAVVSIGQVTSQADKSSEETDSNFPIGGSAEEEETWWWSTFGGQSVDFSHRVIGMLKPHLENNIFTQRLDVMRLAHGLRKSKKTVMDFELLQNSKVPLISPINADAFGGRPKDWGPTVQLTDFIFLSPQSDDPNVIKTLTPALQQFIIRAKAANAPLVAISFSSMPVTRNAVLRFSIEVAEKSKYNARVIALVGTRPRTEVTDSLTEEKATLLKEEGKLLEIGGAPFGILFPFCDFVVIHGGLGTTGEALRAGKPCLVTGVMLFDQRFWAKRIHELGIGPPPVHITKLQSEIVKYVDEGLSPECPWRENAIQFAKHLKLHGHDDGLELNVDAIVDSLNREQVPESRENSSPASSLREESKDDRSVTQDEVSSKTGQDLLTHQETKEDALQNVNDTQEVAAPTTTTDSLPLTDDNKEIAKETVTPVSESSIQTEISKV